MDRKAARLRALLCVATLQAVLPGVHLLGMDEPLAPRRPFRRRPLADVLDTGEPIRIAHYVSHEHMLGMDCSAPGDIIKLGEPASPLAYCHDMNLNHGGFEGSPHGQADCLYTCVETDVADKEQAELLDEVLQDVLAWFATTVAVSPAEVLELPGLESCATQHNFSVPTGLKKGEISGADMVMMLTIRPLPFGQLADSSVCTRDGWGRPTGAHTFLSPNVLPHSSLFEDTGSVKRFLNRILVHEVLHVLGFESTSMTLFRDEFLQLLEPPLTSVTFHDEAVKAVASPTVKAEVQRHFGSAELAGMPLAKSSSSAPSQNHIHWHSGVAVGEIMAEVVSEKSAVSDITLALLEDTGWYRVNSSRAEQWLWGQSQGMAFFSQHCSVWSDGPYNCGPVGAQGCSYDRTSKATCSPPISLPDIPWAMSGQVSVHTPGTSISFLECHVMAPVSDGSCLWRGTKTTAPGLPPEEFGKESRCFMSNGAGAQLLQPVCLDTRCALDGSLSVGVAGEWMECPAQGGPISWNSTSAICPPWHEVCQQAPECPNDCSQAGICSQGSCDCHAGRTGEDCSVKSCGASCQAPNGECVDGVCVCGDAWAGVDCSTSVSVKCEEDCSAYGTGAVCVNGHCEKRCSASYGGTCMETSLVKQYLPVCSDFLTDHVSICTPEDVSLLGNLEQDSVWKYLDKLTTKFAIASWQHSPTCQQSLLRLACVQTFPSCTAETPDIVTPACVSICSSFHDSCNMIPQESGLSCEAGQLFRADSDPRNCTGSTIGQQTWMQESLQTLSLYSLFVLGSCVGLYCVYRVVRTWLLYRSYGLTSGDWCKWLCCSWRCFCCRPRRNAQEVELESVHHGAAG